MGSFVNALVWRLRQNEKSKKDKRLSIWHGRSMCPDCRHKLSVLDLIPVVSWLALRGKCRYCHKPIHWQYPVVEMVTALVLIISLIWWPFELSSVLDWLIFATWTLIVTVIMALVVYDIKWMILPSKLVYSLGVGALILQVLRVVNEKDLSLLWPALLAALALGGVFWLIYQLSAGKWIGGGDVRLGFAMGLLLGPVKAFLAVMAASYLGLAVAVFLVIVRKYKAKMRLPFGPLLLIGTIAAFLFGSFFIERYLSITLS